MFDKIHSLDVKESLSKRMTEINKFLMPITESERIWLKTMLHSEHANLFLSHSTIEKLNLILAKTAEIQMNAIQEKGEVKTTLQPSKIYDIHKALREAIVYSKKFKLTYFQMKDNETITTEGYPYKLEFYIQKQTWYLLWVEANHSFDYLIHTPLHNISHIHLMDCEGSEKNNFRHNINTIIQQEKCVATLQIKDFQERQRILYAFSAFDKEVSLNENILEIKLFYRQNDEGELLQKIRFLGSRIVILSPQQLRFKMKETALKALKNYE